VTAVAIDDEGSTWAGGNSLFRVDRTGDGERVATELDRGTILAMTFAGGRLHLAGNTNYREYPVTSGALVREVPHFRPVVGIGFVAAFNTKTNAIEYSTLLGGEESDAAHALAVDADGSVVVGGGTASRSFPLRESIQGNFSPSTGFLTRLSRSGELDLSTFVGDERPFRVRGVALDESGGIYFAGHTLTLDTFFGVDAFLVKVVPVASPTPLRLDAVLNAASRTAGPVTSGAALSITGAGFGDDVGVYFDDVEAPVVRRTDRELLVTAPVLQGDVTAVHLESGDATAGPLVMPIAEAAPGIYTVDALGYDFAIAWNAYGSRNPRERPAPPGSELTLAVNGLHDGIPVQVQVRTYFSRNLPLRPSDNGRLLLTVSQSGETSREVPIHWQAP
jgi:hypothetical protein